ncbi:MAG: flagellar hook-basal body complex protein FliE [Acidimicrobiales bacterium]
MSISPIDPIAAFASVGQLSGLGGGSAIGGVGSGSGSGSGTNKITKIDFSDALGKVQASIDNADGLSQQLATGELTDIHEYTVAASKAQLGVQLTVAMRNQMLSAFQEIMRMQI